MFGQHVLYIHIFSIIYCFFYYKLFYIIGIELLVSNLASKDPNVYSKRWECGYIYVRAQFNDLYSLPFCIGTSNNRDEGHILNDLIWTYMWKMYINIKCLIKTQRSLFDRIILRNVHCCCCCYCHLKNINVYMLPNNMLNRVTHTFYTTISTHAQHQSEMIIILYVWWSSEDGDRAIARRLRPASSKRVS